MPARAVNTRHDEAHFARRYKGRLVKSAHSTVWRAEALYMDRSYERFYGFVHIYVRLRHPENPKRTKLVAWSQFRDRYRVTYKRPA